MQETPLLASLAPRKLHFKFIEINVYKLLQSHVRVQECALDLLQISTSVP